jgi:hypothetical protein
LPLYYQAFAAFCFAVALAGIILFAEDFTGFYYHPRILALTHLVTLGWITGNIIGTLYMVGPMALLTHFTARSFDGIAFFLFAGGVLGMAAHFWRDLPVGMAWSAGCVYFAILFAGAKAIRLLYHSKAPAFVKLHVILAFLNLFLVGAWGILLAIHKFHGFLPTSSSPNVIAHAHLAAVGWATMMVFGIGYRLLPMFLPGEPAKGKLPVFSALFLEFGILGLFICTILEINVSGFVAFIVVGILLFFFSAIRTAIRRKPAPPPLPPQPDFSMLHAPLAFLCLTICIVAGLVLMSVPATEETLRLALAYGALGLIGFLSQIIIGLKPKILSIFTWYHAFTRSGSPNIPRPVDMPVRVFQIAVFALWLVGLPTMIVGIYVASAFAIRAGATLLLASLAIQTIHEFTILRLIRSHSTQSR